MSGSRVRHSRGSLGDSWGDAEYESDGGASVESASDMGSEVASEGDFEEQDFAENQHHSNGQHDIAKPLPSRMTRASSKTPQDTPLKVPRNRVVSGHSQSPKASPRSQPRSSHSTPGSNTVGQSFIMPSMYGSTGDFQNGSPLRGSQMRVRNPQRPSAQDQTESVYSTPRTHNHRVSNQPAFPEAHLQPPPASDQGPWYYINLFRQQVLWPALQYALSVVGMSMEYMKPLVALGLVAFLLSAVLTKGGNIIQNTVRTALTPVCIIPGSSYILPFCASIPYDENNAPDFDELMRVQSTFSDIVEESKDSSTLPASMKRSEAAIRDIRTLVKYSKLPSRSQLEVEFDHFIATAKEASSDLIRYNQRIGGTLDKVISTNKWTMQILQGLAEKEGEVGLIERVASSLNPLSVFMAPAPTLQQQVFEQYVRHVSANKDDIIRLIEQAQSLLFLLNNLEDRLDVIADIAVRDDILVSSSRDELLSNLWTKLGGNSSKRKDFDKSLRLLKEVSSYRKEAIMHVQATLLKLQEIAAGLENLRDGVAAPEVLGYREEVPLSYHVEIVGKQVGRLEDIRGDTRRIEMEKYRESLRNLEDGYDGGKGLPGRNSEEMPVVYAKPKGGKR